MTPEMVMTIGNDALTTMIVARHAGAAGDRWRSACWSASFQAATQIDEQTLSFIPKLIGLPPGD
jgi:flagellar biosynthetic protein FliQ